jgi:outer membrane immunogenic protein
LNAGGGWQTATIDNSVLSNSFNTGSAIVPAFNAAIPRQFNTHPSGFIGGGQIGYNYQFAPNWVAGLEADFQGANIKSTASATNAALDVAGGLLTVAGTGSQEIDWFGTLRGRLGWLPVDPLLVYATGGLAYGHVQTDVSFLGVRSPNGNPLLASANGSSAISQSDTRAGWTLGGGLEWMFAPRWTVKAEYLHYDLGTETLNQTLVLNSSVGFISANIQSASHYRGDIVRAGLNYRF